MQTIFRRDLSIFVYIQNPLHIFDSFSFVPLRGILVVRSVWFLRGVAAQAEFLTAERSE